jgi:hypothetical protein
VYEPAVAPREARVPLKVIEPVKGVPLVYPTGSPKMLGAAKFK